MSKTKRAPRKLNRSICDSYIHVPRPSTITELNWNIWLKYNSGLTAIECAMVFGVKVHEVTKIIGTIVEQLKNKVKLAEDWSEDFATVEAAIEFKQRLANNIYMAARVAKKRGMNVMVIMGEV